MKPSSFYCSKPFQIYNNLFRIHNKISPCILQWDSENELFEVNPRYLRNSSCSLLKLWYFNTFIVAGIIGFGSCMDVATNWGDDDKNKAIQVFSVGFAATSVLYWGPAYVISRNVDTIVSGLEKLKGLRLQLDVIKPNVFLWKLDNHSVKFWKYRIYVLNGFAVAMLIMPFAFVPAGVYLRLDPFSYTFNKFIDKDQICSKDDSQCRQACSIAVFVLRIICSSVCVIEACRFICLFVFMVIYLLELYITSLEIIAQLVPWRSEISTMRKLSEFGAFFKWYNTLQLVMLILRGPSSTLLGVILFVGFWTCVIFTSVSIRVYDSLPLVVYWFMPTVALLCGVLLYVLLEFFVEVHTKSSNILESLKYCQSTVSAGEMQMTSKVYCIERQVIKRNIQTFRPVALMCGSVYQIGLEFETDYFSEVVYKSTDAILLPIW